MTTMLPAKVCGNCKHSFPKRQSESHAQYEDRRYCSVTCTGQARRVRAVQAGPGTPGTPTNAAARAARLMRPVNAAVADPKWRNQALCAGMDGEQFFPDRDGEWEAREAKALCSGCPARSDCLIWALAADADGIWGGTTTDERRAMRLAQR
jgi:WhiB family transcriptional regulator, redox-sensing transcriptional regulator